MPPRSKAREKKFKDLLSYERRLKRAGCDLIIGVDEAGRGPLAGPVVAAAVALKTTHFKNRIDDSKKLNFKSREQAFGEIIKKSIFGVSVVSEKTIDRINILRATRKAMHQAVTSLTDKIRDISSLNIHVIVDGNMALDLDWPSTDIVKGDAKSKSIASASILAKVTRDRIMLKYDAVYPEYGFARHKGYPTEAHRDILKKIGPSAIHRKSFCCV
ncbi:MAG: ribonuclease HII [Candidatus Omnitrophica bacterium]|nr:ribonuclease HII [Candidatus Omnitrophota bacterium]